MLDIGSLYVSGKNNWFRENCLQLHSMSTNKFMHIVFSFNDKKTSQHDMIVRVKEKLAHMS